MNRTTAKTTSRAPLAQATAVIVALLAALVIAFAPAAAWADSTGSETQSEDSVASVTDSSGTTLYFDDLQDAADAVTAGGTIKLLADVTLDNDTGIAIVNKGTEESRVTFDLNGHTLSGNNAGSGASKGYYYDVDGTNAMAGILQVVGSYVTLTDTSTGDTKGTISNTNTSSTKFAAVAIMLTYDVDKQGTTSDLVIEGGVNVSSSGTATGGTSQGAVYLYGASGKVTSKLTVTDATITGPYAVTTYSTSTTYYDITITGGTFVSTQHAGDSYGAIYAVSDGASQLYTISGGTFNSWTYYQFQSLSEGCVVVVSEDVDEDSEGAGTYTYTVTENVPESYIASLTLSGDDTPTYYQVSGDLYGLQLALDQSTGSLYGYPSGGKTSVYFKGTGATISVVADAIYTMANGDFLGPLSGSTVYLTFEVAEGATLSGSIALGVAQLTITGEGTATGLNVSAVTSYGTGTYAGTTNTLTLDSSEVDSSTGLGTYYCYLADAAALVTYADGSKAYFTSAPAAITKAAVNEGSTVTLLQDVSTSNATITVSKSFTLDLNGHTLTLTRTSDTSSILTISGADAEVLITDTSEEGGGTIKDTGSASLTNKSMFYIYGANSSLTLTNVTIQMYGAASSGYNEVVYADTTSSKGSPTVVLGEGLVIEEIESSNAGWLIGVAIFGYYDTDEVDEIADDYAGTTVQVLDGATVKVSGPVIMGEGTTHGTTVEISGGTLTSTEGTAIYLPEYGTTTISGGTITGALCGIEIRSGTLVVTGGAITSSSTSFATANNGSGTTIEGAGIAVSQHSTNLDLSVTVTGGTITGYYGLYEADLMDSSSSNISLLITGGSFVSTGVDIVASSSSESSGSSDEGASASALSTASTDEEEEEDGTSYSTGTKDYPAAIYSENCTYFAYEGSTYNTDINSTYPVEDYSTAAVTATDEDGEEYTYYVITSDYEASYTTYDTSTGAKTTSKGTLTEAFTKVADGGTVTLLKDVTLSSQLTITKTITLDLNGYTLTLDNSSTGSNSGARLICIGSSSNPTGSLTVLDSSEAGTGTVINTGYSFGLFDVYGSLTIESGTYIDQGSGDGALIKGRYTTSGNSVVSMAEITITGGTFKTSFTQYGSNAPDSSTGEASYVSNYFGNYIVYAEYCIVSITGGTFCVGQNCWGAIRLYNCFGGYDEDEGEYYGVTVSDVTVTTYDSLGIEARGSDMDLTVSNCTVTVDKVRSDSYAYISSALSISGNATITVESGTYQGAYAALMVNSSGGNYVVNGGTFTNANGTTSDVIHVDLNTSYYTDAAASITVTDGILKGALTLASATEVSVSGGWFTSAVSQDYCAEGYAPYTTATGTDDAAGMYTVGTAVASVSTTTTSTDDDGNETTTTTVTGYYADLQEAFNAASSGDTVTLLTNVTWDNASSYLLVNDGTSGKTLTFDLNNYTLDIQSASASCALYLYNADVTIKNGTILDERCASSTYSAELQTIYVAYGDLTLDGVTVKAYAPVSTTSSVYYNYAIYVYNGNETVTITNSSIVELTNDVTREGLLVGVCVNGYYYTNQYSTSYLSDSTKYVATLTVTNSTITTSGYCITGTGSYHNTVITVTDSTLKSGSTAIYHPQYGSLTINETESGTTYIEGVGAGIEMRSGVLTVNGGTIVATGTPGDSEANGSGTSVYGAAVAVSQHTTNLSVSATITGGTLKGYYALYEEDTTGDDDTSGISLSVTGGTFISTDTSDDAQAIYSADCTGFVSGTVDSEDNFTSQPASSTEIASLYCADGYMPTETQTLTVDDTTYYTIQTGSTVAYVYSVVTTTDEDGTETTTETKLAKYSDLQTAIDAAEALNAASTDGTTYKVVLAADVTADVTIDGTVTLDLAGYTLTNSSTHTIIVASGGNLTLVDSTTGTNTSTVEGAATGTGVVDNVTTKCAALYVQEGGTATLSGGTLRRSAETGTSTNTYYTILNQGTLTIEDGTTVELLVYTTDDDGNVTSTTTAGYSSIIDNGWPSGSPSTDGNVATLYIKGGYINGGKYVKNDSYGEMYISGGTIANGSANGAILNWNVLEISGGTIKNSTYAIFNCATSGTTYETGSVTITGGTFTYSTSSTLLTNGSTSEDVTISGGSFSTVVDADYCAEGYAPVTTANTTTGLYTVDTFSITLASDTFTYTGIAISPSLTVMFQGSTLSENSGYTVSYTDSSGTALTSAPTDAGTYTMTVTGTTYSRTDTYTITINPKSLTATDITATLSASSFTYTGLSQVPTVTVTDGGLTGTQTLTANTDYVVYYNTSSSVDVGTYTITVMGKDNYTDTVTLIYTITAADISNESYATISIESDIAYTGEALSTGLAITNPNTGTTLVEDTDYTVSITDSSGNTVTELKDAGTYTVTITGTGNYTGTATKTVTVTKYVASVTTDGGETYTYYTDLVDAIKAARGTSGETETTVGVVTLLADCTLSTATGAGLNVYGDLTIDLNGYTLTDGITANWTFFPQAGASITITDSSTGSGGKVVLSESASYGLIYTSASCSVELSNVTVSGAPSGVSVIGVCNTNASDEVSITLTNATVTGAGAVVTQYSSYNGTACAVTLDLDVSSGSFTSTASYGFLFDSTLASTSTLDFSGATVSSYYWCVNNQGATMTLDNCTFTVTGPSSTDTTTSSYYFTAVATTNGGTTTINSGTYKAPYAVYVFSSGGTVNISGGTFEGSTAALKADADNYDNSTGDEGSTIVVTGGTVKGSVSISDTSGSAGDASASISGGWFKNQVDEEDCAEGYKPYASATGTGDVEGMYTVGTFSAELTTTVYTYTGSAVELESTVTFGGSTLESSTYTYKYYDSDGNALTSAPTNVGTYYAAITNTTSSVFVGTSELFVFTITAADLSSATVTFVEQTYTGSALTPNPTSVTLDDVTLTLGTDYTVTYYNNTNAGAAVAVIAGTGNYTGTVVSSFTINKADISSATVTGVNNATYTGSEITQELTVTFNGVTLTEGSDYTVSYANNVDAGTATITIKGIGTNFTGTKTVTFTISSGSTTTMLSDVTTTYGEEYTLSATVKDSVGNKIEGAEVTYTFYTDKDCTTVWTSSDGETQPTAAGTYYVKATYAGSGSYSGSTSEAATLTINKATVEAPTAVTGLVYNGSSQTGVSAADSIYTVSSGSATNAGSYTATATLTDASNYQWAEGTTTDSSGNATVSWSIAAASISDATVTLSGTSFTYDGEEHEATVSSVVLGSTKLTADTDYTVSYTDSDGKAVTSFTAAGTYTVTITGKGNYTGTATATFTIGAVATAVQMADATVTYTGSAQSLSATVVLASDGTAISGATASIKYYSDAACTTLVDSDGDGEGDGGAPTAVGTYYAKATYAGSTNYAASSATAKLTITRATIAYTVEDYSSAYDGSAHGITVTATTSGATVTYATSESGEYTSTCPTYTNVGTYTVYYKISLDGYDDVTGSATVTITKADQSISFANTEVTADLGGSVSNALTQTIGTGAITYSSSDESVATVDSSTGAVTIVDAGTATITATAAATDNYNAATASYTLTVSEHSYGGDGTWSWSDDYSTATLTLTCTDSNCSATTTVGGTVTSASTATCTAAGIITYTATATYNDTTYTGTKTEEAEATGHSYEATETVDATCTEDGYVVYTCSACGDAYTETIEATGHTAGDAVVENEVEATCTEDGSYDSVVYCTVCGVELSRETVTVEATGHSYDYGNITWTWADDYSSATATVKCATCGDTKEINATITSTVVTSPTCTSQGVTTYTASITVDGVTYKTTEYVTVEATGHTWSEWTTVTDSTCQDDGFKYRSCTVCGLSETQNIDANGHTWETEYTVDKEATCTTDGSKSYHCENCDATTGSVTIPATGHTYVATETVDATCTEGGYVVYTCSACGDTYTETIEATGHTAGDAVVENEVEATCTEDGSYDTVVYCTVCGAELSRETTTVAATGHTYDYESLTWTWADDYSSATVSYRCTSCDDTVTVDAVVTSETTDATCTEDGCTTYTATATVNGSEVTDTKTVTGAAATGHTWVSADEVTWSADYATATLAFTCSSCSTTQTVTASLADATITYAVTAEATATTAGMGVYTATFEIDGATYTVEVEVEIPATSEESDDDATEGDSGTDDGTTGDSDTDDDATEGDSSDTGDDTTEGDEDTDTDTGGSDSGEEDATEGDEESDDSDATDDGTSDDDATDDTDATDEDASDDGASGDEASDDSGSTGETGTTGGGSAGGSAHGTAGGSAGSGESSSADGAELAKTGDATTAFAAGFGLTAALAAIVAAVAALRRRRAA